MKPLTDTASAILGLLSVDPDTSGYALGTFAQHSVAHFWPVTRTHIYNELARLERDGYVSARQVAQAKHPDKRVFRLTEAGAAALDEWLHTSEVTAERRRNPLLLKIFFAHRMPPDRLAELLARHRERVQADRERYTADMGMANPEEIYMRATALYGLRRLDAELAWLDEVEQLLLPPELRPGTGHGPATDRKPADGQGSATDQGTQKGHQS